MTAEDACPLFVKPLPTALIEGGWRGGLRREPIWSLLPDDCVDRAAVHALLRASGLPREELLHQGASQIDLAAGPPFHVDHAALIVGRAALELLHPDLAPMTAPGWCNPWVDVPTLAAHQLPIRMAVNLLGLRVIAAHFTGL